MHENPSLLLNLFTRALHSSPNGYTQNVQDELISVVQLYEKHMVKLHETRNVCRWFVHNGHVDSKYSVTAATIHCINEIDNLYSVACIVILLWRFVPGVNFVEYLL